MARQGSRISAGLCIGRTDSAYVTDLYVAFLSRLPDSSGLASWTGQLAQGMPRSIVANSFLFSPEFSATMQRAFGAVPSRAEVYTVLNLYVSCTGSPTAAGSSTGRDNCAPRSAMAPPP